MNTISLTWRERPTPRIASGLVAPGATARRLLERLARVPSSALRVASFGNTALVVLGPEAALPWVSGVLYVADVVEAPGLFLPTMLDPSVPAALLRAALLDAGDALPAIVLPAMGELDAATIFSLRRVVPLSANVLAQLT